MKNYDAQSIRNVCLLAHGGVGKTSLMEAVCHTLGASRKLGSVEAGNSIFDSRPDEKTRKMTVSMAVGTFEWSGVKINFLDTPGCLDLLGDARAALSVVESAVIMVDAASGIEVGTELVSRLVSERQVARMFLVNGMDKENADFDSVLNAIKETYGTSVAPLQMPLGTGSNFKGVVDLVTKQAYEYTSGGNGKGRKIDLPGEMTGSVESLRGALVESIAESDEELMEKYFEAGDLSDEDIRQGLAKGVAEGLVFPLFCASATQNIASDLFLDAIAVLCPSAASRTEVACISKGEEKNVECSAKAPPLAFVFKTLSEEHVGEINIVRVFCGSISSGQEFLNSSSGVAERTGSMYFLRGQERIETTEITAGDIGALLKLKDTHTNNTLCTKQQNLEIRKIQFDSPTVRVALVPGKKGDDGKVSAGLKKLHEEDPTFSYGYQADIRQSILSAMGDIQVDILLDGLGKRFNAGVERKLPRISYRETIAKAVKYVEFTHKKQTGGAGQYARVFIDLEPVDRGGGYEFVDKIVGGVIDQSLRPSVDKGIRAKLADGILAGYPIVDVKVTLVDGKTHPVDSKDVAFQVAGREVFKKAFEMANPMLLEPIVDIKVSVPEEYMGDVMGDLSSRRAKIGGMESDGRYQRISAKAPESEVQNYSQCLRSITQGRGFYSIAFSHYDPAPGDVTRKVVAASGIEEE